MTIELDVRAAAKRFGLDPALVQAVVQAEGDILKAVRCSLPETTDRPAALDILCRSAVHAMSDFIKAPLDDMPTNVADGDDLREGFIDFWAARWAPRGVSNDPTDLNRNFAPNVLKLWRSA